MHFCAYILIMVGIFLMLLYLFGAQLLPEHEQAISQNEGKPWQSID